MSEPLILAIDIGAFSLKVALVNVRGDIKSSTQKNLPPTQTDAGSIEQDPNLWWLAMDQAISWVLMKSVESKQHVVGIVATSHWPSCVFLDRKKQPLRNSMIRMAPRTARSTGWLGRTLMPLSGYTPEKLWRWIRKSGGVPNQLGEDSLAQLLYVRNREPDTFEQVRYVLEPKDYINFRLTGEIANSPETMALYWITDNRDCRYIFYDSQLLSQLGLDGALFAPMMTPTSTVGTLHPKLATYWGLPHRLPVICGTPTMHSTAIGAGSVQTFAPYLHMGASSRLSCHVPNKKTDLFRKIATIPAAVEDRYLVANTPASGALSLEQVRHQLLLKTTGSSKNAFSDLEAAAEDALPGSKQVLFTPPIDGTARSIDEHVPLEGFHNTSVHHTQSDLVRAVYEGIAYSSKWLLNNLEGFVKRPFAKLHIVGGGAASNLLCQIHADVLERSIYQTKDPGFASIRGAAWLGFAGLGHIAIHDIADLVQVEQVFQPQQQYARMYGDGFAAFMEICQTKNAVNHKTTAMYPSRYPH